MISPGAYSEPDRAPGAHALPVPPASGSTAPSLEARARAGTSDSPADVELLGVTKRFGQVVAVDRLDLRIARGAFYSLLGPSGCGKTTTLRMIAGFDQPSEGEVLIAGQPVAGVPPYRRNVNTVFQHYALFPHMDVERNVGYGLRQRGVKGAEERRRVAEALELVRLAGFGQRRTWELSGGQQQRVALARALVNRPTVLLLDEPLGALDLKLRTEMQLELKSLHQVVGITFVYVTHDQDEAITMSDTIVVMRDGRIQQQGPPDDLYDRPRNRFVAGFLGLSNFFAGRLVAHDVSSGWASVDLASGLRLRGRLTDPEARPGVGAEVTVAARPERFAVGSRGAGEPSGVAETVVVGRLKQATYLGDQNEYRVETDLGEIVARRQNVMGGESVDAVGPGDAVEVRWRDEANLVLAT